MHEINVSGAWSYQIFNSSDMKVYMFYIVQKFYIYIIESSPYGVLYCAVATGCVGWRCLYSATSACNWRAVMPTCVQLSHVEAVCILSLLR